MALKRIFYSILVRKTDSLKKKRTSILKKKFKKKIRIKRTHIKLYVADTDLLLRFRFRKEGFIVQLLEVLLENSLHLSGPFRNCLSWRQLPTQVAFIKWLIKTGAQGPAPCHNFGQLQRFPSYRVPQRVNCGFCWYYITVQIILLIPSTDVDPKNIP